MKVEVWADIICPWCGLGVHRLRRALERVEGGDEVEVVYRSFQLDPGFPEDEVITSTQVLTDKGVPEPQARQMSARVERLAAEDGLSPYEVHDQQVGNTSLAHELLAYATEQGKHGEAWRRTFEAYFGERFPIFDRDSLLDLAEEIGLDRSGAAEALSSRRYRRQVFEDQAEAQGLGARGVPFLVIDRRYGVAGAQPIEQLAEVLDRVRKETEQPAS